MISEVQFSITNSDQESDFYSSNLSIHYLNTELAADNIHLWASIHFSVSSLNISIKSESIPSDSIFQNAGLSEFQGL